MIDYSSLISDRVSSIKPSGIRKFFDIAATMDDVLSLSIGEPDFVTPWSIRDAGIESLVAGRTFYTSNSGLIELRRAVCEYFKRVYNLSYNYAEQVLITIGGSEAIDLCIRTLVKPEDEVIIPQPSFVCYEPITQLVGGIPVIVKTTAENGFKITAAQLKAAITSKTKLLVLPYPNNPTGAIMDREDLSALAEVLRGTNIMVLSDELYAALTYAGKHCSIANIEGMQERTVIVNGFSKAYAMTGWRIGYALGPKEIIKAMTKVHQFAIMSAPTTAQDAAIVALSVDTDAAVLEMVEEYDMRRRMLLKWFSEIGIDCFEPKGAFYVFPCIAKFGLSSEEFCSRFLYEQHVAIVPGSAFGESGEGFARISYAKGLSDLEKAMVKLKSFIASL